MASKESWLDIKNNTNQAFTIKVEDVDSYDWDKQDRPDVNFQNVTIQPGDSNKQREELNKWANSANFNLTLFFAGGQSITFHVDQYEIYNGGGKNPKNLKVTGNNADLFTVEQKLDTSSHVNHLTVSYTPYTADGHCWMKSIKGSLPISGFTIPGTCSSAAYVDQAGAYRSQNRNILEQLNEGVRYFDLDAVQRYGKIFIVYGPNGDVRSKGALFREIFNTLSDFVRNNPTETVIVSAHDASPAADNTDFGKVATAFLNEYGSRIYHGDVIPTLDSVRSKIVIVRRFKWNSVYGINMFDNWPVDGTGMIKYSGTNRLTQNIQIQNHYTATPFSHKYSDVQYLFDLALDYHGPFYLNVTSVSPSAANNNLAAYAANMNRDLLAYFTNLEKGKNVGTVLVNFITANLAKEMIKKSAK
ncbi:hypothetical protein M2352_000614 [Azospirillum fermentarium]|uniref:phosphatidylinositol-specific phospholipase C domain-containing protein n=1 Tax=Azospirillum fermentarium TaxID=1233114 RepID=UPI0022273100|nr:phosphatidylinositol-specific phospholipase C domain-containing protein [Azospirillum fermentarium]MCW2245023.1 hypothetical protein [Azospirillum fermentarium]